MLLIRASAGGTTLTGALYERGERSPSFRGAPDEDAPYVWVCDEFYEVESGGGRQSIDDREVNVAFDRPCPADSRRRRTPSPARRNSCGRSSHASASRART